MQKFYCDIVGTYTGGKNREISLYEFSNMLKELAGDTKLIFSFVSSNDTESVKKCMNELLLYIKDSNVILGKQYAGDKVIVKNKILDTVYGKTIQIYNDLKEDEYDKVYYAEDSSIFRKITKEIIKKNMPNVDLTLFETNGGIDSLNSELSNYIENKNNQNKKTFR